MDHRPRSQSPYPLTFVLAFISLVISLLPPNPSFAETRVSLNEYQTKAIQVTNPVDLTQLPEGQVYQVNHPKFILQFMTSGSRIMGFMFKRDPEFTIFLRWCFFRSCEESPFDYKAVLANPHQKPFNEDFFEVRLPVRLNYKFHGLHFTTGLFP